MKPSATQIDPENIELMEESILDLVAATPTSKNLDTAKKLLVAYRKAIEHKVRGGTPVSKVAAK